MRSTFFGLEVARSSLQSNQVALDVVAHNLANAATAGYSRQQAVMSPNSPFMAPGMNKTTSAGQIGTGVYVEQIRRLRDAFADAQFRKENKYLGEYETRFKALEQMELIYNEPSDTAIRGSIDAFWQSLQDLSVKSEQEPVRTTVRQQALALCDALNHTYAQLDELRKDNDAEIEIVVDQVNSLARQLRDLNNEIVRVEVSGDIANDYRDRRDLLLDDLSKLIGIQTEESSNGAVSVYINGKMLVSPTTCNQFKIETKKVDDEHAFREVRWLDTGDKVDITGGNLAGLIAIRDEVIPGFLNQLDDVATTLATNVNSIHRNGLGLDGDTGIDFFASNNTVNVKELSSYVFNNGDNDFKDFPDGNYTFKIKINGEWSSAITITNPSSMTNKQIVDSIKGQLDSQFPKSATLITDSVNNQTRLEVSSSSSIDFDIADADTIKFLKQLGFTNDKGDAKSKISAKDITVSQEIMASLRNIAAAGKPEGWVPGTPPTPGDGVNTWGDGSNALAMARVKQTKLRIGSAVTTINDYFNSSMSQLGVQTREAESTVNNKQALLDGLEIRRQSVSGVNVDDEMVDMIRFQHGYSAASRIITTLNEMLDTIINRMGV